MCIEEIHTLAKKMNQHGFVPPTAYRRNSIYYTYVTYINHLVALWYSENSDPIPVFLMRADKELEKWRAIESFDWELPYFPEAFRFKYLLATFLLKNGLVSDPFQKDIETIAERYSTEQ